jgi:hypothetical protein
MKLSRLIPIGPAALAVLLVAVTPATAQTFAAGNDALNTTAGGASQVNLASFPAALTALGSSIVGGDVVNLQGVALNSGAMGPSVDTIVSRGAISGGAGSLTIVALNMASVSNLVLADGRQFSLQVCLSDTASAAGTINLTQIGGAGASDGGTFNSSFPVLPKLVFTNASNHSDVLTLDCASGGCNTLTISSTSTAYAQTGGPNNFSPSAEGINALPTGSQTVANCSGTHTINLTAPGGFYPGWALSGGGDVRSSGQAFRVSRIVDAARVQPQAASGGGTFTNPGTLDGHSSSHKTVPPRDCFKTPSPPAPGAVQGPGVTPQLAQRFCLTSPIINPTL